MSLNRGLERPLWEAGKIRPGLPWRSQDGGDARAVGSLPRRAADRSGTSPRERSVLQSTKLKGVGDLRSILTSDMEMQSLEFAQPVFSLALAQHFLAILPFLRFEMAMYILCHYMLEVCDLFLDFDFISDYS